MDTLTLIIICTRIDLADLSDNLFKLKAHIELETHLAFSHRADTMQQEYLC